MIRRCARFVVPEPSDEVVLAEVVHEVTDEWRGLHASHALVVEVREEAPRVTLRCHRDSVAVLAHNLVGNAFAHLMGGRLEIIISRDAGGVATIRFEDDGPGLPEFAAGRERTAENPTANPGYGLGLSLVDRLCALHGWGIVKRPRPGGGTWIEVSLHSSAAD